MKFHFTDSNGFIRYVIEFGIATSSYGQGLRTIHITSLPKWYGEEAYSSGITRSINHDHEGVYWNRDDNRYVSCEAMNYCDRLVKLSAFH